jgi:bifunctional UDP-N-acetylglucosamine pyrophosphorylase/glucosamine-1-phosphate N-acetyltransferase
VSVKVIILAAGQGTRMKSSRPKVLHEIAGRPLVGWMIDIASKLDPDEIRVVVGHEAPAVEAALPGGVVTTLQSDQRGTGHAVGLALGDSGAAGDDVVVVLPGDHPTLDGADIAALVTTHRASGAAATMLTTILDDPTGYGRVLRDSDGTVTGVAEEADADDAQLAIAEVATSVYAFTASALVPALEGVSADNAQGEHYLPDVIGILAAQGAVLEAVVAPAEVAAGVNSYDQLAAAAGAMKQRINAHWMAQGVWMVEPDRTYVDVDAVLEPGVRLYPGVHIEGATTVGAGAEIGPDAHIRDCRIGEDAIVRYSVLESAEVGPRAQVGPYARLRPGTVLGPEAKAGTFVELKATTVGARSKVPHLSYMGDALIGEDSNIGAGAITCNWDGYGKHPTKIGDRAFIGSDTMLVAPIEIGDDAWTGAGSTITRDVPDGTLGVERGDQHHIADYAERRKRRAETQEDS